MEHKLKGTAVPRHYVFVLADGTFAFHSTETKVQDIMTGNLLSYADHLYGHAITDHELSKLKIAGRVEHFTRRFVWLLLHHNDHDAPARIRTFYITTPLAAAELAQIRTWLASLSHPHPMHAIEHDGKIAIFRQYQQPFPTLQDADDVLQYLIQQAADRFYGSTVAVIETPTSTDQQNVNPLDNLFPAQPNVEVTAGKPVMIVGESYPAEKKAITQLLHDQLQMDVRQVTNAQKAILMLEDDPPALALIDVNLPDAHGWTLIKNIRENRSLHSVRLIVISDNPGDEVFALKVARVAAYLPRPVNLQRLREKIWISLRETKS